MVLQRCDSRPVDNSGVRAPWCGLDMVWVWPWCGLTGSVARRACRDRDDIPRARNARYQPVQVLIVVLLSAAGEPVDAADIVYLVVTEFFQVAFDHLGTGA